MIQGRMHSKNAISKNQLQILRWCRNHLSRTKLPTKTYNRLSISACKAIIDQCSMEMEVNLVIIALTTLKLVGNQLQVKIGSSQVFSSITTTKGDQTISTILQAWQWRQLWHQEAHKTSEIIHRHRDLPISLDHRHSHKQLPKERLDITSKVHQSIMQHL